jgi:hypothetical protein
MPYDPSERELRLFFETLKRELRMSTRTMDGLEIRCAGELVSRGIITKESTPTNTTYYLKEDKEWLSMRH